MSPKLREISSEELRSILGQYNRWLISNEKEGRRANLSHTDLRGLKLGGGIFFNGELKRYYDLCDANFSYANLQDIDFNATDLRGADFYHANLRTANLYAADLRGARLQRTDLTQANLSYTFLNGTDLSWSNLNAANFDKASCGTTHFNDIDLSGVNGLETVQHDGPSPISAATYSKSHGRIPRMFLKGCGLANWEIESVKLYQPELSQNQIAKIQARVIEVRAGHAVQRSSVFISYSHKDSEFVEALGKQMDLVGIRYRRDVNDASAGPLDEIIDRAIRQNPTVLLILSTNSVESDWVENEAQRARELGRELGQHVLCPIAIDESWKTCQWSGKLRRQIEKYNIINFGDWEKPCQLEVLFNRLIEGLNLFYPRQ